MIKSITSSTNQYGLDLKTKTVKTTIFFRIFLLFSLLFSVEYLIAQPTITSFAPISGKVGDTITISGTNFNTTTANNVVFFGATRATVATATSTSLTVTVPIGTTFAPIAVLNTATALTSSSNQYFNPTFSPNKGSITQSDLASYVYFGTGTNSYSVAISDIDGNGKPDLAITNNDSNSVSILRNISSSGTVNFATKLDFTTGTNPNSIAIGDIDGDSKPDLAITNNSSNSVSIMRNTSTNGNVSFATKIDFNTGTNPNSIAIGDIDGDGKLDLAITNNGSNSVSILRNLSSVGTVSFAAKLDFTTGTYPNSIVVGDIDGDSNPDLGITNLGSNSVSILRNTSTNGNVSFATKIDFITGTNPYSIAIGDLNGNGKPDLAITNNGNNSVSVMHNISSNGTVNFATKIDFTTCSNPSSVNIGDIDGNGKLDLAVANSNSLVSILRNIDTNGTYNFEAKVDFTIGSGTRSLIIGDLDGDGKPDLTASSFNYIFILRNNPLPPSPTIISISPISGPIGTTVSITGTNFDTNSTNNTVFFGSVKATVITTSTNSLTVIVPPGATFAPINVLNNITSLTASSTQSFNPTFNPNKNDITPNDMATKIDFTTGDGPWALAIVDINADGKLDLATVNSGNFSNSVSILRNTSVSGTISFAPKLDFAVGIYPESFAIGDINGDGKPDLAVANRNSYSVSILRNTSSNGTVSFAPKVDFGTGSYPTSIAIGDVNGDGKPDLAVANYVSGTVSILRNTSNGSNVNFEEKVDFVANPGVYCVVIGDIDNDGKPDLATANVGDSTVSVFRNIYNPKLRIVNFATRVNFTVGNSPRNLTIGDIDGDGKLDLITANATSNSVSVLRNISSNGAPNFAAKVNFGTFVNPYSVSIGDINGDSKPDLIIPNTAINNTVSVLRNIGSIGNINYATKVDFATGPIPWYTAVGDINGDNKADIVTINNNNSTISVLRNNPQFPPTILTTGTLALFSSCVGKVSAQQIFTVRGSYLTANLLVTAPIGFEVSTTSGTGFGSSVSLTASMGIIDTTNIFIRLNNAATGSPNGNIVCTSIGSTPQNIAVNGVVKTISVVTTNISICPSSLPYTWNNRTYNTAKIDTIYSTNSAGCDSLAILKLTVKPTSASTNNVSVCPNALPYTWNGLIFNSAGTQTKTGLTNSVGCDSSATLNLTVKSISTSTNNISICPSALPYTWNGLIFNAAGAQTKTGLTNSIGCDSSATLNLTVNASPSTSNITGLTNVSRLDTASYSVNGLSGSIFNWVTTKGLVQTGAGTNQIQVKWNIAGIDTLKVTETSNQGCIGSQKTLLINIGPATGMHEINTSNSILVYPNPLNETIFISLLNNSGLNKAILYDLLGKEVLTTYKSEIDVKELKSGVYLIMVIDNNGNSYSQKLIKN